MTGENDTFTAGGMRARKSLGQHFLRDKRAIARIVEAIPEHAAVLEIGPGPGALTGHLLRRATHLTVVEADDRFAAHWSERAAHDPHLSVVHADVLQVIDEIIPQVAPEWIAGNLPYNISGPLTARLAGISLSGGMVLMYQREVAERLLAAPGGRTRGGLSVLARHHYHLKRLLLLPPGAFSPPPKVHSAVLLFTPHARPSECSYAALQQAVRQGFGHRRKMLANNFRGLLAQEDWDEMGIDAAMRPEQLDDAAWTRLARRLYES